MTLNSLWNRHTVLDNQCNCYTVTSCGTYSYHSVRVKVVSSRSSYNLQAVKLKLTKIEGNKVLHYYRKCWYWMDGWMDVVTFCDIFLRVLQFSQTIQRTRCAPYTYIAHDFKHCYMFRRIDLLNEHLSSCTGGGTCVTCSGVALWPYTTWRLAEDTLHFITAQKRQHRLSPTWQYWMLIFTIHFNIILPKAVLLILYCLWSIHFILSSFTYSVITGTICSGHIVLDCAPWGRRLVEACWITEINNLYTTYLCGCTACNKMPLGSEVTEM